MKNKIKINKKSKNYAIEMLEFGYKNSLHGVFKSKVIDEVRNKYFPNNEDVMIYIDEKINTKTGELVEFEIPIQDYYGVLESTFNKLFQIVYENDEDEIPNEPLYILKPEYTSHYLSYKQLEDSKKQSKFAIIIACISMIIAIATSITSIFISYKQLKNADKPVIMKKIVEKSINNTSSKTDAILDTLNKINMKIKKRK